MDSADEDVSARVLLRNVLQTELPRSPVNSSSGDQRASVGRRSSGRRKTAGLQTPQDTLRHKLKQKLHESTTQSQPPPTKRPRSLGHKAKTPEVASPALCDADSTPRRLLRGFIQTGDEASLLLSGQPALPEAHLEPAETTSIHSNRQSEGTNSLDLPDLATEALSHVIRGMSRTRPRPTFSVSAFENQLDQQSGEDAVHENMDVTVEPLEVSDESKSVLSLTLKTPFVNVPSERAGLQRKAAQRKKPSVSEFDEAVERRLERHRNQDYTVVQAPGTPANHSVQVTLGLSSIVMSNTELYSHETVAGSTSELREQDGADPQVGREKCLEAERKGDEGEESQKLVADYNLTENLSETPKTEPEMESSQAASRSQNEEELETVPLSHEKVSVTDASPDEIALAPTQVMVESYSQSQEKELMESDMELEGQDWRVSVEEKLPSPPSEKITRRAYHSEGGVTVPGVTARWRGTKSIGAEPQSSTGGSPEECHASEDPCPNPVSPPISHTPEPPSPERRQTDVEEVDDGESVSKSNVSKSEMIDGDDNQSEDEMVKSPTHLCPTLHSLAAVEEHQEDEEDAQSEGQLSIQSSPYQSEDMVKSPTHLGPTQQSLAVDEEHQEDEEDAQSEELSMQTPAFIRQRKEVASPGPSPTAPTALRAGPARREVKPRPRQKRHTASDHVLPKSYVMSVFKHFAKTRVAGDVYPVINEILRKYFSRLADDLAVYSAHAKRKTIEVEDIELLMKRQGFVTDGTPLNVLIERFLPLEYRKLLIPVATSGNVVVPNQRR
ncbi:uncharacterized protein cenpt [Brachyhypopomus gauderio]|uniref:uncharacterized protein cenpt n=1 Tax=Brachyhypopomus gauderio TaxID=698409 RepID=UPI004040EB56